jgi:hypothetical protein
MAMRQSREENGVNLCGVRFEVLSAVTVKNTVVCDVTPCSLIDTYQRFEEHNASIFRVNFS